MLEAAVTAEATSSTSPGGRTPAQPRVGDPGGDQGHARDHAEAGGPGGRAAERRGDEARQHGRANPA